MAMTFYRNKYNAIKCDYDGFSFDSKKERDRYLELQLLLAASHISDLEVHPRFDLMVNGQKIGRYTADFRYTQNGQTIVEDVKSPPTRKARDYRLRKKILATYDPPVHITEI